MPSTEWNKYFWNGKYDWGKCGEEWSAAWGGSVAQWVTTLWPRISSFLPCNNVLEIAPGFGRWTKFLLANCDDYTGIDISKACIEHCISVFNKGNFHVNDGYSLSTVPDGAFDFVFSFDSLVHAEKDVISKYLIQIYSKLSRNGFAFLHLSNFEAMEKGYPNTHNRASDVSAVYVRDFLAANNIPLSVQETIGWGGKGLIDQLIVISKQQPQKPTAFIENPHFMQEAVIAKEIFSHYQK